MEIPPHLVGKSYSKIYKELALEMESIPLGLYREYEMDKETTPNVNKSSDLN
jgi:hypothetical protein